MEHADGLTTTYSGDRHCAYLLVKCRMDKKCIFSTIEAYFGRCIMTGMQ